MKITWKHLFIFVISISAVVGITAGLLFTRQDISPRQIISSMFQRQPAIGGPTKAASDYLSAWEAIKPEKMYENISKTEQLATNINVYVKEFTEFPLRPIKHQPVSWQRSGTNKAFVKMLVTWPTLEGEATQKEEFITVIKEGASWKVIEADSFK